MKLLTFTIILGAMLIIKLLIILKNERSVSIKKCKHDFELLPFFKGYKCTKCGETKEYNMHHIIRHQYYDIFRKANMFNRDDTDFTIDFKDIPNSDKIKLMRIIRDWAWKRYASPM